VFTWWRRDACRIAAALGQEALARAYGEAELLASERYGAARMRAFALRSAAHAYGFERAVPMLREAMTLLRRVEARLEAALTHHDLARRLLELERGDDGRRGEAVELARRGLALAEQTGRSAPPESSRGSCRPRARDRTRPRRAPRSLTGCHPRSCASADSPCRGSRTARSPNVAS
jgi:hypothetical protein